MGHNVAYPRPWRGAFEQPRTCWTFGDLGSVLESPSSELGEDGRANLAQLGSVAGEVEEQIGSGAVGTSVA